MSLVPQRIAMTEQPLTRVNYNIPMGLYVSPRLHLRAGRSTPYDYRRPRP